MLLRRISPTMGMSFCKHSVHRGHRFVEKREEGNEGGLGIVHGPTCFIYPICPTFNYIYAKSSPSPSLHGSSNLGHSTHFMCKVNLTHLFLGNTNRFQDRKHMLQCASTSYFVKCQKNTYIFNKRRINMFPEQWLPCLPFAENGMRTTQN